MSERFDAYTRVTERYQIPEAMEAVVSSGKGLQNVHVVRLPVPEPNDDQVLCRVDACTVCPSILKVLSQGAEHKFLDGWDLARFPIVLGDEGAVTAVRIGKNLRGKYEVGEKLAIQPSVEHSPINFRERYRHPDRLNKLAVGYTLGGTFAQYLLILEEVIESNCLVKLPSQRLSYYEISMSEPLSCVVSSQDHHVHLLTDCGTGERVPRKGLLEGGVVVIFGAGVMGRFHIELALSYRPRTIIVFNRSIERLDQAKAHVGPRAQAQGTELVFEGMDLTNLQGPLLKHAGRTYADDVIDTTASPVIQEAALSQIVGRGTVFNTFGGLNIGENVLPIDMRKVHYDESIITGSSGGNPQDTKRALDLIDRGVFDVGKQIRQVGELRHAVGFLSMIQSGEIKGKAVIYPHVQAGQPAEVTAPWTRAREQEHLNCRLTG